jgi:hypothetical protein
VGSCLWIHALGQNGHLTCLLVVCWIPVRIEEHQPVASDQVQAATPRFAAQQEGELVLYKHNGIAIICHQYAQRSNGFHSLQM